MPIFNYNEFNRKSSGTLPALSSIQLRDVFDKQILTRKAERLCYPVDLNEVEALFEAVDTSSLFTFGCVGRMHRAMGQAVLGVHWERLLSDLPLYLQTDPLTLPLVASLLPALPTIYPILQNLLYRELVSAYASTYNTKNREFSSFDIRLNAFPLNDLERALLKFYISIIARNGERLQEITSLMSDLWSPFVVKSNAVLLNKYPRYKKMLNSSGINFKHFTFFDMSKYDYFKMRLVRYFVNKKNLMFAFSSVPYPTCNASFLSELLQLYDYAVSDFKKWNTLYSPLLIIKNTSSAEDNKRHIAANAGVYYNKVNDLCVVNFRYVPLGRIFGYKSAYKAIGADFHLGSSVHDQAVDNPNFKLGAKRADRIALFFKDKLEVYKESNFSEDFNEACRYLFGNNIWEPSTKSSMIAFYTCNIDRMYQIKKKALNSSILLERKGGKRRKAKIKSEPELPKHYLNATYIIDTGNNPFRLKVVYTYYKRQVYVHFPSVDLHRDYIFNAKAFCFLEIPSFEGSFISKSALFSVLRNSEVNYTRFPIVPNDDFFSWIKNLAINQQHFDRLCKLDQCIKKQESSWTKEEDNIIRKYMRPYLPKEKKEAFFVALPNRSRLAIARRAAVIREQMLSEGVTEISEYPRFKALPKLYSDILRLKREKGESR